MNQAINLVKQVSVNAIDVTPRYAIRYDVKEPRIAQENKRIKITITEYLDNQVITTREEEVIIHKGEEIPFRYSYFEHDNLVRIQPNYEDILKSAFDELDKAFIGTGLIRNRLLLSGQQITGKLIDVNVEQVTDLEESEILVMKPNKDYIIDRRAIYIGKESSDISILRAIQENITNDVIISINNGQGREEFICIPCLRRKTDVCEDTEEEHKILSD